MKLFIARHGETLANRGGIILGRGDSPLTETGRKNSARLAARILPGGTGIIHASPLGRAVSTAEIFSAATGWKTIVTDGLMELSCGAWEGRPRSSVLQPGQSLRPTWTDTPGGGESYAAAASRVEEAIQGFKRSACDNVLVVAHAAVNQIILKIWLSLTPREALAVRHPHDLLYEIEDRRVSWRTAAGDAKEGLMLTR